MKGEAVFSGDYKGLAEIKPEKAGRRVWKTRVEKASKYDKFANLWSEIDRDSGGLTATWVGQSAIQEASVICTTTMDRSFEKFLTQPHPPTFVSPIVLVLSPSPFRLVCI